MHVSRNVSPSPKCRIYNVDGSGRDTYISFNSGGYIRSQGANFALSNIKNTNRIPSSCIARVPPQPKYNHYKSDGTGRDSYISYNSGGFVNAQTAFSTKLREYPIEQRQKRSNSFDISYTMRLPSIQDERKMHQIQEKHRQIRENFNRLAQPKSPSQSPDNSINPCRCTTKNTLNSSLIQYESSIVDTSPTKRTKHLNSKTLHLKDLVSTSNYNKGITDLKQQMFQKSKQNALLEDELLLNQKQNMKTLPSMGRSTMYDRSMNGQQFYEQYSNQLLKTQEY